MIYKREYINKLFLIICIVITSPALKKDNDPKILAKLGNSMKLTTNMIESWDAKRARTQRQSPVSRSINLKCKIHRKKKRSTLHG